MQMNKAKIIEAIAKTNAAWHVLELDINKAPHKEETAIELICQVYEILNKMIEEDESRRH